MRLINIAIMACAAIVALAIGAGWASAGSTTLCSSHEEGALSCQAGNDVSHVHFVDPAAVLLTNVLNVSCNVLFLGDGLGLGTPLVIHGAFSITGCNNGCTITDLSGGLLLVLETASGLSEVTGDNFLERMLCIGVINCEYDGKTLIGHGLDATASDDGLVTLHKQTVSRASGLLCPEITELDALLESLTPLYIKS
jgi:hypothetical protein